MADSRTVTRFAPSPTGYLHVGGARTALFNWLWARHTGGEFHLRIEDTDRKRFVQDAESQIIASLDWLGLDRDGAVVRQSDRHEAGTYRKYAEQLVKAGYAEEAAEEAGTAVRFKWPEPAPHLEVAYFDTGKRQETRRFSAAEEPSAFENFVLLKSDGFPTYNFAHVVEDHELGVTHVIRGAEFIPSLNKYVMLHQALGWPVPRYVHVPAILGPDQAKLSKRHGAKDVLDYRADGFLPEALVTFIALIGGSPGDDRELFFERDELVNAFTLDGLQKSPGVFDERKLRWMNGEHLKQLDLGALQAAAREGGFWEGDHRPIDERVLKIESERVKTLADIRELRDSFYYQRPKLATQELIGAETEAAVASWLERAQRDLESVSEDAWTTDRLQERLTDLREKLGLAPKQLFPVLRVALTGAPKTPAIWELAWALGKEETLTRLEGAAALVT